VNFLSLAWAGKGGLEWQRFILGILVSPALVTLVLDLVFFPRVVGFTKLVSQFDCGVKLESLFVSFVGIFRFIVHLSFFQSEIPW